MKKDFLFRSLLMSGWQDSNLRPPAPKAGAITGLRYTPRWLSVAIKNFVGVAGFEPAASCSQSRRDNRATLHPDKALIASANVQKNFIYSMFLLKKLKKIFSIKVINYIIDI